MYIDDGKTYNFIHKVRYIYDETDSFQHEKTIIEIYYDSLKGIGYNVLFDGMNMVDDKKSLLEQAFVNSVKVHEWNTL